MSNTNKDFSVKDLIDVAYKEEVWLPEFQEIKEAISGSALGKLIIKDATAVTLGMGKKFKKIKVNRFI